MVSHVKIRYPPEHHSDKLAQDVGFAGFENYRHLVLNFAAGIHRECGSEGPFFREFTTHRHAAVKFGELGVGPVGEDLEMPINHLRDLRVGGAIEFDIAHGERVLKQFVGIDSKTFSQLVQCAGVWASIALGHAADGTLVEAGRLDHLLEGHAEPGHEAADIGPVQGPEVVAGVVRDRRHINIRTVSDGVCQGSASRLVHEPGGRGGTDGVETTRLAIANAFKFLEA
jgi:hypothetical protein